MKFDNFEIYATPHIIEAYCRCGNTLIEVSNGLFSRAMFCSKCENVYQLKLIKVPQKKISSDFLKQARKEVEEECSE